MEPKLQRCIEYIDTFGIYVLVCSGYWADRMFYGPTDSTVLVQIRGRNEKEFVACVLKRGHPSAVSGGRVGARRTAAGERTAVFFFLENGDNDDVNPEGTYEKTVRKGSSRPGEMHAYTPVERVRCYSGDGEDQKLTGFEKKKCTGPTIN